MTLFPIKQEIVTSPIIKVVPFLQCSLLVATFSSSFLWDFVNSFIFFYLSLALGSPTWFSWKFFSASSFFYPVIFTGITLRVTAFNNF